MRCLSFRSSLRLSICISNYSRVSALMASSIAGVYSWEHAKGAFPVTLRSNNIFYCPSFPASSTWKLDDNSLEIDWKSYGSYLLQKTDSGFEGGLKGQPDKWRKMKFLRPLNEIETLLMGEGGGSVWNFQWEKGGFEVEFRVDGLNHFVCPKFPAHSHWFLDDETGVLEINWGKYGDYTFTYDPTTKCLIGNAKGEPTKWRKAAFLRGLSMDSLMDVPEHDHAHHHVHDENCKH